ncbi:MAG TPA: dihydrolipoamide acetyltransferase family protein [Fimbriimonadales bacterium]|nr:dihydrolipoamide acetyltransferase family protein [Fimbriimonadales bacterium]
MTEVIMPKMGDAMEEGTLLEWLVDDGAKVKSGDVIGNIETDKATVELTAPTSGTLSGIIVKEGDTVPVGEPIAAILKEGESLPAGWANGAAKGDAPKQKAEEKPEETPEKEEQAAEAKPKAEEQRAEDEQKKEDKTKPSPEPAPEKPAQEQLKKEGGRVFASPLARKMAADAGIAIDSIKGTGPNGRIVERDVEQASKSGAKPRQAPAPQTATLQDRVVDLTTLQRITAERTAHAKANVPHYYVTVEVDAEALESVREHMNAESPDSKLSMNDFIVKACAMALAEQPHINASFENGKRHEHGAINIGIAAAVPNGLTLPVLKNCESKTLRALAEETRVLVERARQNKLSPDELSGSSFAISNMGMFDVSVFSAIINEPNGAIIAVGTAKRMPVVVDGDDGEEIQVRSRMNVTGAFDHRIIDGAVGAKFMGILRAYLEAPTRLLS